MDGGTTGPVRGRQRGSRHGEILDVCVDLLHDRGCRALKMDDVARALGISKATLYEHFRTRDDLIRTALDRSCKPLLEHLESGGALRDAVTYLSKCALGLGETGFSGCCFREVGCPFGGWGEIDGLVNQLASAGADPSDATTLGMAVVLRALIAAVLWHARTTQRPLTEQDVEQLTARVLSGICD
ncbi:MAG TPA: TetR/AcrR family transcriptional regulator [Actinomycetota bacterium]|nr:TetR/AcrR family transcriptional regulator [Actinomycetota bacterium]